MRTALLVIFVAITIVGCQSRHQTKIENIKAIESTFIKYKSEFEFLSDYNQNGLNRLDSDEIKYILKKNDSTFAVRTLQQGNTIIVKHYKDDCSMLQRDTSVIEIFHFMSEAKIQSISFGDNRLVYSFNGIFRPCMSMYFDSLEFQKTTMTPEYAINCNSCSHWRYKMDESHYIQGESCFN